jgi:hypothetical protein
MITEIGIIAGEIWHFLDDKCGRVSMEELTDGVKRPKELILMSLGWLAREGHVQVVFEESNYRISLSDKKRGEECVRG